jgi:hypothetical protein
MRARLVHTRACSVHKNYDTCHGPYTVHLKFSDDTLRNADTYSWTHTQTNIHTFLIMHYILGNVCLCVYLCICLSGIKFLYFSTNLLQICREHTTRVALDKRSVTFFEGAGSQGSREQGRWSMEHGWSEQLGAT